MALSAVSNAAEDSRSDDALVAAAIDGDVNALGTLFNRHERLLRRMIHLRLDRRVQARLDVDDVLQDVYLEYARSLPRIVDYPGMPFYLWLRMITARKLQMIHRAHLGVAARDVAREISIFQGPLPEVSSQSLAIQLLGRHTSPSQAARRHELQLRLQMALDQMEPLDREILALRHFEELTNQDVANLLEISAAAASSRFLRALKKLRQLMKDSPSILD